jgi:hypothetical protein
MSNQQPAERGASSAAPLLCDGISTIYAGTWDCPACAEAVEVTVRLDPPQENVAKVRSALMAESLARQERQQRKGKRARNIAC